MKVCIKCNTINDDKEEYCTNCGAKLLMPMMALVCPNCGKVSALGTTECPICHHRLSAVRPKMVTDVKTPRQNKKLLRFLAIVFSLIGLVLFIFLSQHYTGEYNYTRYMGIRLSFYDKKTHRQGQAYYVIKGGYKRPAKNKPFTLEVAYLGNKNSDEKKFGSCSSWNLSKLYKSHRHYKLYVRPNFAEISGPSKIVINVKQKELISNGKTPISALKNRRSGEVTGNPIITYIRLSEIVPNSL